MFIQILEKKCKLTLERLGFIIRPVSVEFVVDKLVLGQVFLCHYLSTNAPYSSSFTDAIQY